jgi:hypothetical protein
MAVAVDQDFSLERLERLLRTEADVDWRHDVDFDPYCALKMAQFERRLGVQATYYVMARSESYNPFAPKTAQTFREIVGCGHMLGLHVDLGLGRSARVPTQTMVDACIEDRALLSRVLPVTDAVSFHAPPHDVYWRDVPGFEHALSPEWEERYVADSRGVFAHGSPEQFLDSDVPLQVGLHPEWWFWTADMAQIRRVEEAGKP